MVFLRIGTRDSSLAMVQAHGVEDLLHQHYQQKGKKCIRDKDSHSSDSQKEEDNIFHTYIESCKALGDKNLDRALSSFTSTGKS